MNTNRKSTDQPRETAKSQSWPHKLNKALIAIGVIAFGLIVTDRLLEAFKAGDEPATAASVDSAELAGTQEAVVGLSSQTDQIAPDDRELLVELQNLLGSRVVFASATEPSYLVTEDERRISVGDALDKAVDDSITLSGVTTHQIIINEGDELRVFNLPDPVVQ